MYSSVHVIYHRSDRTPHGRSIAPFTVCRLSDTYAVSKGLTNATRIVYDNMNIRGIFALKLAHCWRSTFMNICEVYEYLRSIAGTYTFMFELDMDLHLERVCYHSVYYYYWYIIIYQCSFCLQIAPFIC